MMMEGRKFSEENGYRYGFNGNENDNENKGMGLHLSFGDFGYDPRIVRRWNTDPKESKYPGVSPYVISLNNPIIHMDPDGKDAIVTIKGNVITVSTTIFIYGKDATAAAATSIQQSIMNSWAKQPNGMDWTYTDPATKKIYTVKMDVLVQLYNGKQKADPIIIPDAWNPLSRNNYVEVNNNQSREYVQGGDEGIWTTNTSWSSAHEWGHLVGLDDKYTDPPSGGGSIPNPFWSGNIMASPNGTVDQRNIDGMVGGIVEDYNIYISDQKDNQKWAEAHNRIRDAMIKGGARFVPFEKDVPKINYDYKTNINTMSPSN